MPTLSSNSLQRQLLVTVTLTIVVRAISASAEAPPAVSNAVAPRKDAPERQAATGLVSVSPVAPASRSSARTLRQSEGAGFMQRGYASWYGAAHHGQPTTSGEPFDEHQMTAAHRTLPLGSRVLVTDLQTGRAVEVRINDRGPHLKGRIIDLSRAAARRLGFAGRGVTRVGLTLIATPDAHDGHT